ncbi:MAG: hypothetical protein Q9170_007156 [Blastenia crenularia]
MEGDKTQPRIKEARGKVLQAAHRAQEMVFSTITAREDMVKKFRSEHRRLLLWNAGSYRGITESVTTLTANDSDENDQKKEDVNDEELDEMDPEESIEDEEDEEAQSGAGATTEFTG